MTHVQKISVAAILRAAVNPRGESDARIARELGQNMKEHGQHQAILVKKNGDHYELIDGERRWHAAQLVGISELDAIVLEKPTDEEILIAQMNIDMHRIGLSPMERSHQLQRIKNKKYWSVIELSEHLHIQQPQVTKLLAYQKLHPLAQAALHEGHICMERAFILSSICDQVKQLELLTDAPHLSRDQLRRKAHSNGQPIELKTHRARFEMPGGLVVVVQGPKMALSECIDALLAVTKELRQAQRDHLDVVTASRVLADKSKVAS